MQRVLDVLNLHKDLKLKRDANREESMKKARTEVERVLRQLETSPV